MRSSTRLTPKTKPLSPKRSAMIAALDVGTSKVACLIARLRPYTAQDALRRRTHSIEVIGFGHTLARGMKAGVVKLPTKIASSLPNAALETPWIEAPSKGRPPPASRSGKADCWYK